MKIDLQYLAFIAIEATLSAGKVIQKYMNADIIVEQKDGGSTYASQVVTKVDLECERIILSHLQPTCEASDIGLLSEESNDDGSRFEKDYFWCIDPMDGTLAFINKQPGFSVSIALIAKDGTPVIGVVFDPSTETLYHAIKGHGAYKNRTSWNIKNTNDYLTYATDKTLNNTANSAEIQQILNKHKTTLGLKGIKELSGAGAVMCAILALENGPACFFKLPKKEIGGGSIWDYAATACIYQEFGLQATTFSGETLDLNKRDSTFMNDEGVCYANLA
ncbi:3'(2'), 5'-bisphosphate nucleotidase [Hyunsoonleella jejuensis]|uniref:3'(2'), 5'-bisphosphate nucleotidase n=1 Tax=Hyunsoonleella jejuensis TaxID=419940 RepID=A0A1H9ARR6_9FLAO|nr:inositol monophosphatase family protein [Hyunsoonleella jejuensis]SEP79512.1 3'(2'), 5'-bisphosphate nucleotidase [Hyunsoonleella jejuensis]